MIDVQNLNDVSSFLNKLDVQWYINAGFALYLQDLPGDLSDVDIRVFYDDLAKLNKKFEYQFAQKAHLRPPLDYKYGKYDTLCIELSLDVKYDIYSTMRIVRDGLGVINFPFDEDSFKSARIIAFEGLRLPVASLEQLLPYYLVLRRNEFDVKTIKRIIANNHFKQDVFDKYLRGFEKYREIKDIYQDFI